MRSPLSNSRLSAQVSVYVITGVLTIVTVLLTFGPLIAFGPLLLCSCWGDLQNFLVDPWLVAISWWVSVGETRRPVARFAAWISAFFAVIVSSTLLHVSCLPSGHWSVFHRLRLFSHIVPSLTLSAISIGLFLLIGLALKRRGVALYDVRERGGEVSDVAEECQQVPVVDVVFVVTIAGLWFGALLDAQPYHGWFFEGAIFPWQLLAAVGRLIWVGTLTGIPTILVAMAVSWAILTYDGLWRKLVMLVAASGFYVISFWALPFILWREWPVTNAVCLLEELAIVLGWFGIFFGLVRVAPYLSRINRYFLRPLNPTTATTGKNRLP